MEEGREMSHMEKYDIMNYWNYDDSSMVTVLQCET
jgi:hypothetical protein